MPSDFPGQLVTTESTEHGNCCCLQCPDAEHDCADCGDGGVPHYLVQIPDIELFCAPSTTGLGPCPTFSAPATEMFQEEFGKGGFPSDVCEWNGCVENSGGGGGFLFCTWCEENMNPNGDHFVRLTCGSSGLIGGGKGNLPFNPPRWIVTLVWGWANISEPSLCSVTYTSHWINLTAHPNGEPGGEGNMHCAPVGEYTYWYTHINPSVQCGPASNACTPTIVEPVESVIVVAI